MAAAPAPDRRIASAAAGRPRRLDAMGLRSLGRPSPPRASSIGGVQPPTRPRGPRLADRPGASDRPARRPRTLKPRDRPAALSVTPDDRNTPVPRLPVARDHRPRRTSLGPLGASSTAETLRGPSTPIRWLRQASTRASSMNARATAWLWPGSSTALEAGHGAPHRRPGYRRDLLPRPDDLSHAR
jgi:hypothetical protein